MRIELIELHKKLGSTFVYVTHDQVEAMSMADTIVLMNKGEIQQEASPELIYREPSNLFTAQFIGVPPMNTAPLGKDGVSFGFRPEAAVIARSGTDAWFQYKGIIMTREMLGSETIYQVKSERYTFMIKCYEDLFTVDEPVYVGVSAEYLQLFGTDDKRIAKDASGYQEYLDLLRSQGDE